MVLVLQKKEEEQSLVVHACVHACVCVYACECMCM